MACGGLPSIEIAQQASGKQEPQCRHTSCATADTSGSCFATGEALHACLSNNSVSIAGLISLEGHAHNWLPMIDRLRHASHAETPLQPTFFIVTPPDSL